MSAAEVRHSCRSCGVVVLHARGSYLPWTVERGGTSVSYRTFGALETAALRDAEEGVEQAACGCLLRWIDTVTVGDLRRWDGPKGAEPEPTVRQWTPEALVAAITIAAPEIIMVPVRGGWVVVANRIALTETMPKETARAKVRLYRVSPQLLGEQMARVESAVVANDKAVAS